MGVAPSVHPVATACIAVPSVETGARAMRFGAHANRATLRGWRQGCLAVVKLAPVKFVALLKCWELVRLGRQRRHLEVRVLQRINGVDARLPVQL